MKPRTKLQVEVYSLAQRVLQPLTAKQKEWALSECLDHRGHKMKIHTLCLDCGEKFGNELVNRKKAICPHCNTKLEIIETKCRTDEQWSYFAIAEIHGDFQVIRNFKVSATYNKKGNKGRDAYIMEVLQHWVIDSKKREVIARLRGYVFDNWGGLLEIRNKEDRKLVVQINDVLPYKYFPGSIFKAEYSKYGINENLNGLTFLQAIKIVPNHSMAETLLKAKQYSLLYRFKNYSGEISRFWPSIRICMRNNYIVKDAGIWLDYLDLLKSFGKDLHSPKYLFPKDLKKEHDKLVEKRRAIQRMQELEKKKKQAIEDEKEFIELKSKYFGLIFKGKEIVVRVLESVQEFVEVGDKLKHCVFTNEYYKKEDSLILSAEINGNPIETVEVNLDSLEVVQSRGFQNQATDFHDKILRLVKRNIPKIKELKQA